MKIALLKLILPYLLKRQDKILKGNIYYRKLNVLMVIYRKYQNLQVWSEQRFIENLNH